MILPRFVLVFALFSLMVGPVFAWAATKEDLSKVESELSEQREKAEALEAQAKEASEGLASLREKLIAAAAALQVKEEQQATLEDKLDELSDDIDATNKKLNIEKHKLNLLTDALLELSRQPRESEIFQNDLTTDHIHRTILLRAVLPRVKSQTETVAHDLTSLNDLQVQMAEQKQLVIAAQANLQGQQHDLDQMIRTRQGLLNRTEAEKESIAKQLVSLSSEAKDLHQLLDKVTPKHAPHQQQPALKSVLKPPVAGTVMRGFGVHDSDGVVSQGLTFTALPGSPVVAPQGGKVVFVGPFRGYGQIVILQHESGYHSFLAGFGRIDADMGQEVEAGEPLGVLPVKSGARPELYFEWRRNNEPVDPTDGIALSKSR